MDAKVEIFNLSLSALLLNKQLIDADTDKSREATALRIHWNTALNKTLQDLDLNSTTTREPLELVATNPNTLWLYAYKYPNNCAFFRRIANCVRKDNRSTRIPLQTGYRNGIRVIYTNEEQAVGEWVENDINLSVLNPSAKLALAHMLAYLSASLNTGKSSRPLKQDLLNNYMLHKSDAQETDSLENFNYDQDIVSSEFVATRMS